MNLEDVILSLKSEKDVSFRRLLKICIIFFGSPRIKGSHHIFKTPWPGNPRINIQKDGSKAKTYQIKQVREALEKLKDSNSE